MTKQDIITKYSDSRFSIPFPFNGKMLLDAMEEYAKLRSIEYGHYLVSEIFPNMLTKNIPNNAEDLYELYLKDKTK